MTTESWLEDNNRYLAASLKWLRLRLQRLVPAETAAVTAMLPASAQFAPAQQQETAERPGSWRFWRARGQAAPVLAPPDSPRLLTHSPGNGVDREAELRAAAAEREAAAAAQPPPALLLLAERLGLSAFERDTLLLCAAMEYDPGLASLCAKIHGNATFNFPSFGLAMSAFDDPSWDALSAQRPLRYARLVEVRQSGAPLTASRLQADERIVNYLKGLNMLDDRLASLLMPVREGSPTLSATQQTAVNTILQRLRIATGAGTLPLVQLAGNDGGSRFAVAQQVCQTLERRLYRLELEALPAQVADIELLARLWQRESVLLPVALYIEAEDLDKASAEAAIAFRRFLAQEMGLVFLAVREALRLPGSSFAVDVSRPTPQEQFQFWLSQLPDPGTSPEALAANRETAQMLAGQFSLNLSEIAEIASTATKSDNSEQLLHDRLWDACRELTRPRMDALAQRFEPKAQWDELILPAEQLRIMDQIAGQVRERHKVYSDWGFYNRMNRGLGISALFAGESGTGKTMAAEVLAHALRLDLYRIDLSAVVSKYIGETEKNLRRVFDAAEQGGAILFFDEADALFGKRSEVRDSHDRYANIEINYLLQRMESFTGLAILATNMKSALDPAFLRRLRFVVDFPFPSMKERSRIWSKALPAETPKEGLDYERLARLNVSGGNIHSIALNAAFLAAQASKPVTMPLVLAAARTEMKKLEKPFSEAEFK